MLSLKYHYAKYNVDMPIKIPSIKVMTCYIISLMSARRLADVKRRV